MARLNQRRRLGLGLVLVVMAATVQIAADGVNPGFRVVLTNKGLDYIHDRGLEVLKRWLCNYEVPTVVAQGQVGLANVSYIFTNIVIHSLDFGQSSLTSDTRGVVLNIRNVSFSFSTDFNITENDWPHYRDTVWGKAFASGVSLRITIDLLTNVTNTTAFNGSDSGGGDSSDSGKGGNIGGGGDSSDSGKGGDIGAVGDNGGSAGLSLNLTSCKFHIDGADLIFRGGASYAYNLFGPGLSEMVKWELNTKSCTWFNSTINDDANEYIHRHLPTIVEVYEGVEFDFSLVDDANFSTQGRIVTDHKGEFRYKGDTDGPQYNPGPLPLPLNISNSSMAHILIGSYVADSAAYAFWKAGLLAYNISSSHLYLYGYTKGWCDYAKITSLCARKYYNKKVTLGVEAIQPPNVTVVGKQILVQGLIAMKMFISNVSTNAEFMAFTLHLQVEAGLQPFFKRKDNYLSSNITTPSVTDFELAKTNIGKFNLSQVEKVICTLLPSGIKGFISEYLDPGFPIPTMEGFSFTNSSIHYGKDYIIIKTDFSYTPTFLNKNMTYIKFIP